MNQLYDDDIIEYSHTLEMLQKENLALKHTLRRYMVFGGQGKASYNLHDADPQQSLREAEKLFGIMFDTLQVPAFAGSVVIDDAGQPTDFMFTRVNRQFAEYFHMDAHDILGKCNGALNLMKSGAWLSTIASVSKTLDTRELEIQEGDDTLRATVFSTNHESFVAHFVLVSGFNNFHIQDNGHNLKFTQMMVDAIPTPLFYKDMEGHYLLCNKSYARNIIGVSMDTILGKTALELEHLFPKEYADFYQEKDIELIKQRSIQTYEGPIKCADGEVREYLVNKTLIKDGQGNFIGILGVMQDIDRLLKARRDLAASENRYKALFNGIAQPIIVVDYDGNIVMLNNTASDLFAQYNINVQTGQTGDICGHGLFSMDQVRKVCDTRNPFSDRVTVEMGGRELCFLITMQPLHDFLGENVVQIICDDITEIRRFQTELLVQKQQAEQSNNLKTIFLQNIAHETRTPANIISGTVQMMKAGINAHKHGDYLQTIYMNCRKLLDIIDDIVELSKIESGQVKIRHEICSINNIVEEAYACLSDMVADSGKDIKVSRSAPCNDYESLIYADSQYIHQVFRKLISNAVTFTERGSIEIGALAADGTVTFYVRDTGIGIPQDKIKLIFERFRQGDEGASRQYGGTGLGLSIVNELVNCMNGVVSVDSRVGEGSDFRFSIRYERAGL